MAEQTSDTRAHDDEPERRPAAGGVSLAEEGPDELPALLAIAVGIAVIFVILAGSTFDYTGGSSSDDVAAVEITTTTEAEADDAGDDADEPEPEPEAAGIADADLDALRGEFPDLGFAADGGVLTLTGEVADDEARAAAVAAAEALPGVTEVVDQLTIAAPAAAASVDVTASQASITLAGTVPSQELADEILARAQSIYSEDQIDNQLVVDDGVAPPVAVTVTGATTDAVLFGQVQSAFTGIVGVDPVNTDGFVQEESNELESSLNSLDPIQFASGSAQILPDSLPIVDEAAEFLLANPDVSLEVGGHTDSVGGATGNQTLSQDRADAVVSALRERGVENDLIARGFGETRLKEDPDDTAEKQQANRRIEFRILG